MVKYLVPHISCNHFFSDKNKNVFIDFSSSFQYIGCIEVKESMRSLDFETRTALARFDQTLFYSQIHVMHDIFICNVFSLKGMGW